jgi:tetratricopeptide (TPR) repeat protein
MIGLLLLVAALSSQGAAVQRLPPPTRLESEVMRAFQLLDANKFDEARPELTRLADEARAAGEHGAAAESWRGLARVAAHEGRDADAKALLRRAIEEADAGHLDYFAGRALHDLGFMAYAAGDAAGTRKSYEDAAARFQKAGAAPEYAMELRAMTFTQGMPFEEKVRLLERASGVADRSGDRSVEGRVLHQWGDILFMHGDYAGAVDKTLGAVELLDAPGDRFNLARALTSLGRAQRAHGYPEQAIAFYQRGLAIQEALGDVGGQAQSENAIATSLDVLGRSVEALQHFERAFALAQEGKAANQIRFQRSQLAEGYLAVKRYDAALKTIQEVLADHPDPDDQVLHQSRLAGALAGLKRWPEALEAADEGVAAATRLGQVENGTEILGERARIRRDAGMVDLALADGREMLTMLETLRKNLVPDDYLKRGFGERFRDAYRFMIALLASTGRHAEAVVAAEQARGRAFVDLLASKDLTVKNGARLSAAAATTQDAPSTAIGPLTMRGAIGASGSPGALDPNLPSLVSVPSMSLEDLSATARTLRSTLIAFWVDEDATCVWIVQRDGTVAGHRAVVTRAEIERLVRATWEFRDGPSGAGHASTTRGLVTRGGTQLSIGAGRDPYRRLYDLLLAPLESDLPAEPGARITIVPHGPLFGLSFAALMDGRGRYLLERYTLHYSPSAAALQFTSGRREPPPAAPRYLLVADPVNAGGADDHLPRLPGARIEADAVRALLPPGTVTIVSGARADRARVGRLAPGSSVLHFATHGVVLDDRPLDSYLALANGRLTARDIYAMDLHADLVILSACRSASGRITGDGIMGLTRAFFYAGTPSILATLSDVADVSAEYLVPRFYRSWQRSHDKAAALRTAQLSLLRALRAGEIKVQTAAGEFVVPEHPALWAPFVLIGQP